jgi:uncharacterized membrane protein YhaH (DUF805 family)
MPASHPRSRTSTGSGWWNLLLLIPFVGLLWVPFYNRTDPSIFGIPFFYWYQFLWVLLTSLLIYTVQILTDGAPADDLRSEKGGRP